MDTKEEGDNILEEIINDDCSKATVEEKKNYGTRFYGVSFIEFTATFPLACDFKKYIDQKFKDKFDSKTIQLAEEKKVHSQNILNGGFKSIQTTLCQFLVWKRIKLSKLKELYQIFGNYRIVLAFIRFLESLGKSLSTSSSQISLSMV